MPIWDFSTGTACCSTATVSLMKTAVDVSHGSVLTISVARISLMTISGRPLLVHNVFRRSVINGSSLYRLEASRSSSFLFLFFSFSIGYIYPISSTIFCLLPSRPFLNLPRLGVPNFVIHCNFLSWGTHGNTSVIWMRRV